MNEHERHDISWQALISANGGRKRDGKGEIMKASERKITVEAPISRLFDPVDVVLFDRMYERVVQQNPELTKCTPDSLMAGVMQTVQFRLEANTPAGQVFLTPRRNEKTGRMECVFNLGGAGLAELMGRCAAQVRG